MLVIQCKECWRVDPQSTNCRLVKAVNKQHCNYTLTELITQHNLLLLVLEHR